MQYEPVIGLEVHAQLKTASKIFCGCSTKFGQGPNSETCQVCIGMPGVLPVLNKTAMDFIIKTGLAVHSEIAPYSRFARKNYFYPDLPKGYQISQYEAPLCVDGALDVPAPDGERRVGIVRAHLEEDAAKTVHAGGATGRSLSASHSSRACSSSRRMRASSSWSHSTSMPSSASGAPAT